MTIALDDEALQRLANFATAQAERAERRRLTVKRLTARGRTSEAEAIQAKEAEASALAEDVSKLLAVVTAMRAGQATTGAPSVIDNGRLEEAQAAWRAASERLETIATAASNAVAHLQQVSPTSNPVLIHENALNAFRWLERTAKAGGTLGEGDGA